jgi:hypothetical protein
MSVREAQNWLVLVVDAAHPALELILESKS